MFISDSMMSLRRLAICSARTGVGWPVVSINGVVEGLPTLFAVTCSLLDGLAGDWLESCLFKLVVSSLIGMSMASLASMRFASSGLGLGFFRVPSFSNFFRRPFSSGYLVLAALPLPRERRR